MMFYPLVFLFLEFTNAYNNSLVPFIKGYDLRLTLINHAQPQFNHLYFPTANPIIGRVCIRWTMFYIHRVATGRFQFLPLILTLVQVLGIQEKRMLFHTSYYQHEARKFHIGFSSVVLSRIVISRRGICVLSRLMREKRICQEFNQLGRTLIAKWQLSCSWPSESLVVKHDGVFDTFLLTSNIDTDGDGHVGKSFLKGDEVALLSQRNNNET